MRRIDELHMAYPFAGSRMLRDLLGREGVKVGRLHVIDADEADGDRGDLPSAATRRSGRRGTRSIPTCCASWR